MAGQGGRHAGQKEYVYIGQAYEALGKRNGRMNKNCQDMQQEHEVVEKGVDKSKEENKEIRTKGKAMAWGKVDGWRLWVEEGQMSG